MKKPLKEDIVLLTKLVKIFDWLSVFSSSLTLAIIIIKSSNTLKDVAINIISIASGFITLIIVILRTLFNQYKTKLTSIISSSRSFNNYNLDRKKIIDELKKLKPNQHEFFTDYDFRIICQNHAEDDESENFSLELIEIFISSRIRVKHSHSIEDYKKTNIIKIYLSKDANEIGTNISNFLIHLFDRISLSSEVILSDEINQDEILIDVGVKK